MAPVYLSCIPKICGVSCGLGLRSRDRLYGIVMLPTTADFGIKYDVGVVDCAYESW